MSELKALAINIASKFLTFEVFQSDILLLNLEQQNISFILVTLEVSHLEISPLKGEF